ncbi:MAG: nitrous oxide reductase family maturation protein NosD [Alphaproteobacteria bacterium]|nr:nitrous oxide reductase family maturation protein NosD [Alphaproteobacteria bacterium]
MNRRGRVGAAVAALVAVLLAFASSALAVTVKVDAKPGALAAALAKARSGDVLTLEAGIHQGGLVLAKPVALQGLPGAVIEGGGEGSVIRVTVPGVSIRDLTIRKSGIRPVDYDSAIFVEKQAGNFTAERNWLDGNLFGIVLHGADKSVVKDNRIDNRSDVYDTERGNAIHLWAVDDSLIEGNRASGGRDGVYVEASHGNQIKDNHFQKVRFAIHYMFANRGKIIGNRSRGNRIGFALMYSNDLEVRDNVSIDDEEHGLMLHTSHRSLVEGNRIRATREKCVFIYTATSNVIRANRIENCELGLHFTGGSENSVIANNAFVDNRTQVKYTGTVFYEWSEAGRGNYWSDNPAFDLDGDGTADAAYRPNTVMDRLVWRYPLAKLLMSSPVMEALKIAQSHFPALMPGGVIDSHPLMAPPPNLALGTESGS